MIDQISPYMIAIAIFLVTYFLIAVGWGERTSAALAGAGALWALGVLTGGELLGFIDLDTLVLLFGMMVVVGVLTEAGFFRWLGLHLANYCKCRPTRMLLMFTLLTGVLSAFLPNIATILFMVAVIIEIMEILKLDPIPYVIGVILASNIGGTATLIGDPPNMMIATASGMSFTDFIFNVAPIVTVGFAVVIVFLYLRNRRAMEGMESKIEYSEIPLKPKDVVGDRRLFTVGSLIFSMAVALFFLQDMLKISPPTVAILSAIIILFVGGTKVSNILERVEWDTLIFLASIFIVVGGLEKTGVIHEISVLLSPVLGGNNFLAVSVVLWFSAFVSAFIDNIPFTATFIPVLKEISVSMGGKALPLWWGLSLGAGLGGNGTIIGSVVNIVAVGVASKRGYIITFSDFLKIGMTTLVITTATANLIL
ncbi:MAG: SLC13 family permease, partial [Candidatus Geothermarchaeales archaeon]